MDSPPPTPLQTTDYNYNNTDNYNKDNCLFIDTTTTTTTMISQPEYYGEDLFGSLSSQRSISPTFTTTTQDLFPPISERNAADAEGDNNFNNNDLQQDISVMDDDDIFAEISDTFCLNDSLQRQQQPITITTEDFLLF